MSGATPVLEVVVGPAGDVVVTTKGFAGASCREASRALEQALGARTGERLTAEFHQAAAVAPQVKQQSG